MDLEALTRRLSYELGSGKDRTRVVMLTPDGGRYDVLSLNWDRETGCWVLVGEEGEV